MRPAACPASERRWSRAPSASISTSRIRAERSTISRQVLGAVVLEAMGDAEAVAQRRRQQAGAGGRPDQGEGRQRQGHGPCPGSLPEHHRQLAVLHRRIERLLDGAAEAVDLVDEEDAAGLQRGEEGGDVGLALQRRAGGLDHRHAELGGDDVGERGLAEPGRAGEEDVVERLPAAARRLDEDRELLGHLRLVDEVRERRRAQRAVEVLVGDVGPGVVDAHLGVDRDRLGVDAGRANAVGADVGRVAHALLLAEAGLAQRRGDELLRILAVEAVQQLLGLQRRVAEVDQPVAGQGAGVAARPRPPARPPPRAPPRPSRAARR